MTKCKEQLKQALRKVVFFHPNRCNARMTIVLFKIDQNVNVYERRVFFLSFRR